jgi:hypothetical protein
MVAVWYDSRYVHVIYYVQEHASCPNVQVDPPGVILEFKDFLVL